LNKPKRYPTIPNTIAILTEIIEMEKKRSVYRSFSRRRSKLNKKIKIPSYRKMSKTLLKYFIGIAAL
jgi:hypothetical protein